MNERTKELMKKQFERMNEKTGFYLSNLLKSLPMTDYNEVQNLGLPCPVRERKRMNILYTVKEKNGNFQDGFGAQSFIQYT